jgi:hypothetical protein
MSIVNYVVASRNLFILQESLDDINLFSVMTVMAFLLSAPLMLSVEGIKFSPSYLQSTVSIVNLEKLRFGMVHLFISNTFIF